MVTRFFFFTILLLSLNAGCTTEVFPELSPPCARPRALGDGWVVASPESVDFRAEALCKALSRLLQSEHNIHGILVAREGQLVAEIYRRGTDHPINVLYGLWTPFSREEDFGPDKLHDIRSISKSVISLALGVAIEEKKIESERNRVERYYPNLAGFKEEGFKRLTLENLLTMSSGLHWDEGALPNDETRLFWKDDQERFVLDRSFDAAPGEKFHYNSGATVVLADVLGRATGQPWLAYVKQHLFSPLDIQTWEWATDFRDRPLAFTGLRLLPRDLLKFGQLILDEGKWKGQKIVPSSWVETSIRPHIDTGLTIPSNPPQRLDYGYQWWGGYVHMKDRDVRWSAGFGNGGQRIFVIPTLKIAIVTLSGAYHSEAVNVFVNQFLYDVVQASEAI